ncbi:MAG: prolyl oligopeptidase family serine peptidase [Planctomycetes bacterium]|nr:prolyl oligopeptidase family serine peptidase [Planctomycetota bacterium]
MSTRSRVKGLDVLAIIAALSFPAVVQAQQAAPPTTPKRPLMTRYHGVKVVEDYRWLEDWSESEVQEWSNAQNAYARGVLDALPAVPEIRARIRELIASASVDYFGLTWQADKLFAIKYQPPKQQPLLVVLDSPQDLASERVLLDPVQLDATGGTTIDFYVPSPEGRLVAVSLSQGGSESGDVHIYETETGKEVGEVIPRVNGGTAGGDVAWLPDASGFYYTRYPRPGEPRPEEDMNFFQQVYFHKLGSPTEDDRYEIGKDFPRIAEIEFETGEDGHYLLASVANGDGGEFAHYLKGPAGNWTQITELKDEVTHAEFGGAALYLLSHVDAPRGKVLRLSLKEPRLAAAEEVVPESAAVIESYEVTPTRLYVVDLVGGPQQIRVFDHNGQVLKPVESLPVSSVGQVLALKGDDILFRQQSYTVSPAWYHYEADTGRTTKTALASTSPVNFDDAEIVRVMAASKDGTQVPLNILCRKGTKLDGSNPTLLSGYGGFGVSITPGFSALARLWLDQGGVYAVANLRGGGEFGEEWHRAGKLTNKQNVFDDFAACAQYLIDTGYTSPKKLAIRGGSNGGLLMGAMLTQHPEMFRAVVSAVGIYDMLRVELTPNGVFNIPEYGTVKDEAQFKALYAYSPYHRVVDGTAYPATLFTTGANDPRVAPWHSRKMTARLQAATSSDAPILLRTSAKSGHGIGSSLDQRIEEMVDAYAFLFRELGVAYQPVDAARTP